jgi:structural maintenance of chromosomes protein 6
LQAEEKKMDTSLKQTKTMIADYEAQIATETKKLEVHTQEKREETNRKLERAKENVSSAEAHLRDVCERKRQKQAEMDSARAERESAEQAIKAARTTIEQCNQTIQNFKKQEGDALAKYGQNMRSVLADIGRMKWHGEVIGPFGMHVKVKEPEKWGDLLRSMLGGAMTSFAITDARDMAQLKDLFKRTNKYGSPFCDGTYFSTAVFLQR